MHVRKNHPVSLFTGKNKAETSADRLVKLVWRSSEKSGKVAHSTRCFSIPVWQPVIEGNCEAYTAMLVDTVGKLQRKIAQTYVENMLDTNGGVCNDIPADILTPEACLAYFEENDTGEDSGRLNKAMIAEWFNDNLNDKLMNVLGTVKGYISDDGSQMTAEQLKELQQSAATYRATMEKLAAPKPGLTVSIAKTLATALGHAENDGMKVRLVKKLDTIINPPAEKQVTLDSLSAE